MKAWRIPAFGIGKLSLDEVPAPQPAPGQVVVDVHAVSLNYRDLMTVKGLYNPRLQPNRIPCSDGAGIIAAIGQGVTKVAVGDRVAGTFFSNGSTAIPPRRSSKEPSAEISTAPLRSKSSFRRTAW